MTRRTGFRRARAEAPRCRPRVTRSRTAIACSVLASLSTYSRLSASLAASPRSMASKTALIRGSILGSSVILVLPIPDLWLDWLSAHLRQALIPQVTCNTVT